MQFLEALIYAAAFPGGVFSHTVFTTLFVDDVDQGDGTCVRMNMTPQNSTYPIIDLSSNDMACGMLFGHSPTCSCTPVGQIESVPSIFLIKDRL